ncbi:MAG: hypothetical protein M3680_28495 [Myxococcota bacterium]|nr:hypothetical protein [Myxococcota bacterium]
MNLLANSKLPAARLVEILWYRWRQENGFKHGVERWGSDQLDGRSVESYPPGTIIPKVLATSFLASRGRRMWGASVESYPPGTIIPNPARRRVFYVDNHMRPYTASMISNTFGPGSHRARPSRRPSSPAPRLAARARRRGRSAPRPRGADHPDDVDDEGGQILLAVPLAASLHSQSRKPGGGPLLLPLATFHRHGSGSRGGPA